MSLNFWTIKHWTNMISINYFVEQIFCRTIMRVPVLSSCCNISLSSQLDKLDFDLLFFSLSFFLSHYFATISRMRYNNRLSCWGFTLSKRKNFEPKKAKKKNSNERSLIFMFEWGKSAKVWLIIKIHQLRPTTKQTKLVFLMK